MSNNNKFIKETFINILKVYERLREYDYMGDIGDISDRLENSILNYIHTYKDICFECLNQLSNNFIRDKYIDLINKL